MATTPNIDTVYPASGSVGIVTGDVVRVLFDQAMDETTINTGTFVVMGEEDNFIFGPDFTRNDEPGVEDDQLWNSPYAPGYVAGIITFRRIDASGSLVETVDYSGDGTLYRTEAVFTPTKPFTPTSTYTVWLSGDEDLDDNFDTGVRTRTVFDTEEISVSGTGSLTFGGGYTGTIEDTISIEITVGGAPGQAEYIWWLGSDPLTTYAGITTTGRRLFSQGVWVECDADGSYTVGDTFQTALIPSILLSSNYSWSFTTGSGSIVEPPSEYSTTGIEQTVSSSAGGSFTVSSISPENRSFNNDESTLVDIAITFSSAPASGVNTTNIQITAEPVNGDTLTIAYTDPLTYTLTQIGAVVTATLDAEQLYQNNIVKIEISDDVLDSEGNSLTQYSSYFATIYSPIYTSIRRIRLDLGPLIATIPNDTIMLAIFEASLYVDAISFVTPGDSQALDFFNFARRELTTCLAELMLVQGSQGYVGGDTMSKSLGDLAVSRGGASSSVGNKEDDLRECVARWTVVVESGGGITPDTSLKPGYSIKGATAEDAMAVARLWESTSSVDGSTIGKSAANSYKRKTSRRWVRDYWRRS
jgi:hypothetical protein